MLKLSESLRIIYYTTMMRLRILQSVIECRSGFHSIEPILLLRKQIAEGQTHPWPWVYVL